MSRSSPLNGSADFRCNINDHLVDGPLGPGDPRPFGVNLTTVNLTQAPYCSCGQFNRCGFHPQQTGPGVVFDSFPDTSAPAYQNNTATTYLRGLPVDTTITQGAGAQFGSTSADYSTIQDNGQNWPGSIPYEDLGDDKQPDPNIGGCDDQFSPGNPSCPTVPGIRNIPFLSSLADYYQQTSYSHPPTTSAGSVPAEPSLSGPGLNSTTYAPSSASESVCAYSFYENFEPFDVPAPPLAPPGSQSCLAPHSEGSSPETQHYKTPIDSQELSSNISAQGSLASASAIVKYTCDICGTVTKYRDRHLIETHQKPQNCENKPRWYRCRCGHFNCASRKWEYKRHQKSCKLVGRKDLMPTYHCRCGLEHPDKEQHKAHYENCAKGQKKLGRPRRSSGRPRTRGDRPLWRGISTSS